MKLFTYRTRAGDIVVETDSLSHGAPYAVISREESGAYVVFPLTRGSNHCDDSDRANRTRPTLLAAMRLARYFCGEC